MLDECTKNSLRLAPAPLPEFDALGRGEAGSQRTRLRLCFRSLFVTCETCCGAVLLLMFGPAAGVAST